MNANSIPLTPVKSSKLHAIGHDAASQTLAIQFFAKGAPGNVYHYANFTAQEYTAFASAESVGKHFIAHIQPHKDKHPYVNMGVPAAAPVAAAVVLIGPMPVERDECGWWSHPGLPDLDEGQVAEYKAWLAAQGLVTTYKDLESEDLDHPAYVSYYDQDSASVAGWNPQPPEGDGWFTISIHDTEEGPYWVWARRAAQAVEA